MNYKKWTCIVVNEHGGTKAIGSIALRREAIIGVKSLTDPNADVIPGMCVILLPGGLAYVIKDTVDDVMDWLEDTMGLSDVETADL